MHASTLVNLQEQESFFTRTLMQVLAGLKPNDLPYDPLLDDDENPPPSGKGMSNTCTFSY